MPGCLSISLQPVGLRPLVCVRRAPLRIAATAVPVQHAAASAGNGTAAPAPQLPQQSAAVPVTVTAPVPSVLPPAMVYETVSMSLHQQLFRYQKPIFHCRTCCSSHMQPSSPCPQNNLKASNLGAAKAAMPFGKTLLLGVLAGVYVGLCAALLMTVGPNCPGIAQANPGKIF